MRSAIKPKDRENKTPVYLESAMICGTMGKIIVTSEERTPMKPFAFLSGLAASLVLAFAVAAAPTIRPTVDYSADMAIAAGKEHGTGHISHSGASDRREMTMAGHKMTMISDAQQMVMIVPGTGMAMRMSVPKDPVSQVYEQAKEADFKAVGKEIINGEATTKYEVTDDQAKGHVWLTSDGILMRARMNSTQGDVAIDVSNVKRGPQDASLFEVPKGLMIMDMDKMGGLGGMAVPPGMGK